MNDIGVGDWVECVDASIECHDPPGLVAGSIYQIEAVDIPAPEDGRRGILLVRRRHPGNVLGLYRPDRFRPIYRPRGKELIRALIGDRIREDVRADAVKAGILRDIYQ